jgi:predicted cupin superfamily sugar epimerase
VTQRPPLAETLDLQAHPEGGWYRRTWASDVEVSLPDGRVRPTATAILFLLPAGESSAWHRVTSDEVWIAQRGSVRLELGGTHGRPEVAAAVDVGTDLDLGQVPQVRVPAGTWQRTVPSSADALVSCVVSPGFDFDDFELDVTP